MRSHTLVSTFVRVVTVACLSAAFLLALPQRSAAGSPDLGPYTDADGVRWVTGCVDPDLAAVLVEHGGFIVGGPLFILCLDGTTLVAKRVN